MTQPRSGIRTFAVICVAIISLFIIGMGVWMTFVLSTRDWCSTAIGAARSTEGNIRPEYAVSGCFSLLKQQVDAIAWNSHIYAFAIALCLLALMVIVVAGGRISFKGGKEGFEGELGREDEEG